jgi:hypothetical protein
MATQDTRNQNAQQMLQTLKQQGISSLEDLVNKGIEVQKKPGILPDWYIFSGSHYTFIHFE